MWNQEKLLYSGQDFKQHYLELLSSAQHSIDLETYIFDEDNFANEVLSAINVKVKEGVKVRLLVDGFGSWRWLNSLEHDLVAGIELRVYHPLPWPFNRFRWQNVLGFMRFMYLWQNSNKRNHQKLLLIDENKAVVGSHNVCDESLQWRETSVLLAGNGIETLKETFNSTWSQAKTLDDQVSKKIAPPKISSLVLHNHNIAARHSRMKFLLQTLKQAKNEVWVTTPYFYPPNKILKTFCELGKKGIRLNLLLPSQTDVPFSKWLATSLYAKLINCGVKIYEYQPHILHAKCLMVDDILILGSSNLNFRSLRRDLELDVVLTAPATLKEFQKNYLEDIEQSQNVLAPEPSLFKFLLLQLILIFRSSF